MLFENVVILWYSIPCRRSIQHGPVLVPGRGGSGGLPGVGRVGRQQRLKARVRALGATTILPWPRRGIRLGPLAFVRRGLDSKPECAKFFNNLAPPHHSRLDADRRARGDRTGQGSQPAGWLKSGSKLPHSTGRKQRFRDGRSGHPT